MFGALVCICALVTIRPSSVVTPAFSRCKVAVFGVRPSANSISSAAIRRVLPSCSNKTAFNSPSRRASSNRVFVNTAMPSRRKTFSSSAAASASKSRRIWPLRWIKVTCVSKRAKNCANSTATAPPPRTINDFGGFARVSASSLVR